MKQIKRLLPVLLILALGACMAFGAACSKKYTVSFDSDGGTTVASQTVKNGQKATQPEDPTKDKYEFDGWFSGETKYNFDSEVKSDVKLTAHWTRLYTVTFDVDGGSPAPSAQVIRDGGKATQPQAPTKTGCGFGGWKNGAADYDFDAAVRSDLTLKAAWTLNTYTVTFDSAEGSAVAAQTVDHGGKATLPTAPTRAGYTFGGWFVGGTEYNFDTAVTGDVTLTAHWTLNTYTVTFDSAEGSAVAAQTVDHGGKAQKPADPTRENYAFDGWFVGATEYDFDTAVTGGLTLTAHWTRLYTVTFDVDGGTAVGAQVVRDGAKAHEPATSKQGFVVEGWYVGANKYNFDAPVTSDLTLTAHWTAWSAENIQITAISIDTKDVKKAYNVGEPVSCDGLKITLTAKQVNGYTCSYDIEPTDANVTVDTSEYNADRAGEYSVYVSYTFGGITRNASYTVTVTSVIGGIHGIEIVKTKTEYDIAVDDETPVQVNIDDIKVYAANEDGTRGDEIAAADYTLKYYLGAQEITLAEMTNQNARTFQIWASATYTQGTETYEMSDFVLVKINGNNIVRMELVTEGATLTQTQSYTDGMSSTWKFNVEYRLGQTGQVDLGTAQKGTGNNQYLLSGFSPVTVGAGKATLTYHYAVGTEIWKAECEVPYSVTPATENIPFKSIIDVNVGTDDGYKDTATAVITKGLSAGDEIVPFMVYVAAGSGLGTNSENKNDTSGQNKLYGRVQFASARGMQLYIAGPATVTLKARYGSSSGSGGKFQLKQGDTVIAETAVISNTSQYETVTLTVAKAGAYDLYATASLNTFAVEINGTILAPVDKIDLSALSAGTISTDTTLGSDVFTLMGKGGKIKIVESSDTQKPITVGGVEFNKWFSFGGSLKGDGTNAMKLVITEDMLKGGSVTLTVYASHGGSADETRILALYEAGKNGSNYIAGKTADISKTGSVGTIEITTAGTYYFGSAGSGITVLDLTLTYAVPQVPVTPDNDGGNV